MCGESGVEVANDGKFEDVFVTRVRAPGFEADVAERHDIMERKDFDRGDASKAVEIAGWELFRFRCFLVPNARSDDLRGKAVRKSLA